YAPKKVHQDQARRGSTGFPSRRCLFLLLLFLLGLRRQRRRRRRGRPTRTVGQRLLRPGNGLIERERLRPRSSAAATHFRPRVLFLILLRRGRRARANEDDAPPRRPRDLCPESAREG
ncbi:unnamed protein product, partial [Scytosiphon promiscuus]